MYVPELVRREGLRRGLSPCTIKTYSQCLKQFFRQYDKDPKRVKKRDIKDYLYDLKERGMSGNTLNVHLNALKFFYTHILHKRLLLHVAFSRKPKKLPVVLSASEVRRLLREIKNPKHRLLISLMYGAGLRVSEVISLRVRDLELDRDFGWVRLGKGNKDRPFIIPQSLKEDIWNHIQGMAPHEFLFKGRSRHISPSTVRMVLMIAARRSGITKDVHPHTLRHSFSTHLIEQGNPVTAVQSLLGHTSPRTTLTYVHIANPLLINIQSPLDVLCTIAAA